MFDAQLLNQNSKVYSPWMPRQGDYCEATIDFIVSGGTSPDVTVTVLTKAEGDAGGGISASGTMTVSTVGQTVTRYSVFKDLVRFKFAASNNSGDWVMFRMLRPVWFDEVDAS